RPWRRGCMPRRLAAPMRKAPWRRWPLCLPACYPSCFWRVPSSNPFIDMSDLLILDRISLAYDTPEGHVPVVNDLSLRLRNGHIGCLLGSSGCGKTTVLRSIAGFEPLREGRILLGDEVISLPGQSTEPQDRQVG